ncbi:MAG: class II aldolase/adducin family protein [Alphaproteobacteria bacterium]
MTATAASTTRRHNRPMSEAERQTRIDLAAAYRLFAHFGRTDMLGQHLSARLPDNPNHFLLNPFGWLFEQVTASSLIKLDMDGNVLDEDAEPLNYTGFVIHGAVMEARKDVNSVMHTHTPAGVAISMQRDGLLPLSQGACRFYGNLGYHDYEGVADDLSEQARLVRDLGPHQACVLRNHGLLTAGRSVGDAFYLLHDLETACEWQLKAQASGAPLAPLTHEVASKTREQYVSWEGMEKAGSDPWPALMRLADKIDPSYRDV